MSYLLKEFQASDREELLAKTLREAENLERESATSESSRELSEVKAKSKTPNSPTPATTTKPGAAETSKPNIPRPKTATSHISANQQSTVGQAAQKGREPTLAESSSSLDPMSSQRNRPGRSSARGGSQDTMNVQALWSDFHRDHLTPIAQAESRAKYLREKIIEIEARIKLSKDSGVGVSQSDIDGLDALYREQVKISEEQKPRLTNEGLRTQLILMIDMKKHEEQAAATEKAQRASSSRASGMDFDGPSDSPVPSPADNRQVRKLGTSRTSSQPPSRAEGTPSEASERISKPKIVYAQNEEVAFKRKTPGKPEEQDWILGKVVRVIGEGKSRRYDVEDPYPDTSAGPVIYKSSASQMVPIPPEGTPLEDYEIGKRVLALYPETTTFYRAEVKAMMDGGANVQLLFEDEAAGELKVVTRRLVLDHKG